MRRKITELDESTGRIVTGRAPKRAKRGDFDITLLNTRRARIARKLWG